MAFVGLISEAPSGKTSCYNRHRRMRRKRLIRPTGEALAGRILRFSTPILTFILSAKIVHHFPLTVNDSVTYSIAFFYICLNLFLRYLWLNPAFSAVRFNVHGINRSDMQHVLRKFS